MKCPKYILQKDGLHQKTLAESGFLKKDFEAETNNENQSNNGNGDSSVGTKFIKSLKLKNSTCNEKENHSDDNDIIANSRYSHQSKLKKKIHKSLSQKSALPEVSTPKVQNASKSNLTELKLNSSDLCDCSFIKDELIIDMFENIGEYEPIEMCHDLNSLLDNAEEISNILSSPIINMEIKNELDTNPVEDSSHTYETDKTKHSRRSPIRTRTRSGKFDKSISNIVHYKLDNEEKDNLKKSKSKNKEKNIENALSEELENKLKLMTIQLQHRVPPQHKIEINAGSRAMDKEMTNEFERYGPLKRGPFTPNEDAIIKKNWQDFCEIHEWDVNIVQPFLSMRHKGKYYISNIAERRNFVRFLANGLPWRSLYSVYFRFKNLFIKSINTGHYTSKEDKIIKSHMCNASSAAMPNKCFEVAKILKRKRQSVWQRFQKLKQTHDFVSTTSNFSDNESYESDESQSSSKKKKVKTETSKNRKSYCGRKKQKKIIPKKVHTNEIYTNVNWTTPLVNKLIKTLLNVTSSDNVEDLKYKKIDDNIWIEVEKNISIDCKTLQNFWYIQLHLQLFSPTPIYLNKTKMNLIKYMNENKDKNLEDIAWEDVCLSFDGITTNFLSKLFDHLVQNAQKQINSNNLKDTVQYLYEYYLPKLEDKKVDSILPKIYCKDNRIVSIDKGTEKKILHMGTADSFLDTIDE